MSKSVNITNPKNENLDFFVIDTELATKIFAKYKFEQIAYDFFHYRNDCPAYILSDGRIIHKVTPIHFHLYENVTDFSKCFDKLNFNLVTKYSTNLDIQYYYFDMVRLKDESIRKIIDDEYKTTIYDDKSYVAMEGLETKFVYLFFKPHNKALFWFNNQKNFYEFISYFKGEK